MLTFTCPRCGQTIPKEEINHDQDTARCPGCRVVHSYARLVEDGELQRFNFDQPPAGAWLRQDSSRTSAGVRHYSPRRAGGAFLTIILAVIVASAIALLCFGIPWGRTKAQQYLIPTVMLAGPLLFLGFAVADLLSILWGRTEIEIMGQALTVRRRVGWMSREKHFDLMDFHHVQSRPHHHRYLGEVPYHIELEARQKPGIELAHRLPRSSSDFLVMVIRKSLRALQAAAEPPAPVSVSLPPR